MVLESKMPAVCTNAPHELHVVSSGTELIQIVYNLLEHALAQCRRARRQQIFVGLSGGSLIQTLSDVLPSLNEDYLSAIRFIFCDERRVPFDNPESTFGQYVKIVLPTLQPTVSKDQFIAIDPTLPVNECAADYEEKLRRLVGGSSQWPEIDVLLLGLGPDGHTCSLFPDHPVLKEERLWVAPVNDSPKPPPERVTLTLPVLNRAKHVIFVATGASKAEVVKEIIEGGPGECENEGRLLPAARIKPAARGARVHWILDKAAASQLSAKSGEKHSEM